MFSVGKKGLSILMALLISCGTVGVVGTVISDGTLSVSAAESYNMTLDVGKNYLEDFDLGVKIVSSNTSVIEIKTVEISGKVRATMLAKGPGNAVVTVKNKSGVLVETINFTVKGAVQKKSVELYSDKAQYISVDGIIKGLYNTDGSKFVDTANFKLKIENGKLRAWGNPGTYKVRVVTNNSITEYTVTFSRRTYTFVKGIKTSFTGYISFSSITSSNKSVAKVSMDNSNKYTVECLAVGSSVINVKYTNGTMESYNVAVRDSNTFTYSAGMCIPGGSNVVDYSSLVKSGVKITSVKTSDINGKYVITTINGNKVTYTVSKQVGYNNGVDITYYLTLSNGDKIKSVLKVSSIVANMSAYTYSNATFKLSDWKSKYGLKLNDVTITNVESNDSNVRKYIDFDVYDDMIIFSKNAEVNSSKDINVPFKIYLSNGIVWYVRVKYCIDDVRALNMTINNQKTINMNNEIFEVSSSNSDCVAATKSGTYLTLKAKHTGTAKVELEIKGSKVKIVYNINVGASNKTYNKTLEYTKDGTKIAIDELKNTGATVEKAVVDKADMMEISTNLYSIVVKPRKAGVSTITVTCTNGDIIKYVCIVKARYNTYNKTIGYNINGTKIAVVELNNTGGKVKTVSVDNTGVMGVVKNDYSVVLKPKKAGKATVTVTCTTGDIVKYVCTVNSLSKTYSKTVTLDTKNAKTMDVNADVKLKDKGLKITKVENKSSALLKNVTKGDYNFKYTMIKKGTATVKVTLSNGDVVTYNIMIK